MPTLQDGAVLEPIINVESLGALTQQDTVKSVFVPNARPPFAAAALFVITKPLACELLQLNDSPIGAAPVGVTT
jgi:hypothetical protein